MAISRTAVADDRIDRLAAATALAEAHTRVTDPHRGALWLETKRDRAVWLVEIIPTMPADSRAEVPMEFLPSRAFRYPLKLVTGRESDLKDAIERDRVFAQAVLNGVPVPGPTAGTKRLQQLARSVLKPSP